MKLAQLDIIRLVNLPQFVLANKLVCKLSVKQDVPSSQDVGQLCRQS